MPWSGQGIFRNKPLVDWTVDGHVAGKTRSHGGFTFATIDGAGHLVRIVYFCLPLKLRGFLLLPRHPMTNRQNLSH